MAYLADRIAPLVHRSLARNSVAVRGAAGEFAGYVNDRVHQTEGSSRRLSRQISLRLLVVDLPKLGHVSEIIIVAGQHYSIQSITPGTQGWARVIADEALTPTPPVHLNDAYYTLGLHGGYWSMGLDYWRL